MSNKELAIMAAKVLSDKKAIDVTICDIKEKASFADYLIICHGTSERQINNLVDYVEEAMAKEEQFSKSVEGRTNSGWILIDFGDIVVNLFTEESRSKYNLEKVWADCPRVDFE